MTKEQIGLIQVAGGAALLSFCPVFVKIADVGPTVAGFYRMLFGGVLVVLIMFARRENFICSRWHFLLAAVCGALFAVDLIFWHRSIHYVGPGLSTLLANFQVFFLAGFGVLFLREKLSWKLAISVVLAMIGLFLIVGIDFASTGREYRIGVALGLATAVSYATYLLVLRRLRSTEHSRSPLPAVAIISLVAAGVMAPVAAVQGESFHIPDTISVVALVAYGLIGQVLGWMLVVKGISKVESSRVGLVLLLQPTLAFVWDIVMFARVTTAIEVVGAAMALIAIYIGSATRTVRKLPED